MDLQPLATTVVGDYPKIPNRPRLAKHRVAMAKFAKGEITFEELRKVEREVTIEVMKEQADAGVDIITDGQIRWEDAQTYIAAKLDGFEITGLIRYFDSNCYYRRPSAVSRVTWKKPITVQDYRFAHDNSEKQVKPVITGPYTLAKLSVHPAYERFEDFVLDVADALNQEMRALQQEHPTMIQVNEPAITWHKEDSEVFSEAMKRLMGDVTAPSALYTYFGDVMGLEDLLKATPFDVIGLDMVQGSANWHVVVNNHWEKTIALGVVDARNTKLENWNEMFLRLEPLFSVLDPKQIMINPSCGLEFLPREIAQSKLTHMVEGVNEMRRRLRHGDRKR
jgi:5-methyltetrahydropteroyltriglutamate--homocysteine methyltransferase